MTATLASVGDTFAQLATDGTLLLAIPVALLAGLVSFLSPCMLPLVPGYLSYVTGLSGVDVADTRGRRGPATGGSGTTGQNIVTPTPVAGRGRLLAGSTLFVLGFAAVFVSTGALFGGLGGLLAANALLIQRFASVLVILLGLGFMGFIPWMQREARWHRLPRGGLAGAPALGALFGIGWTPCLGPTLAAVLTLAANEASAGRGALLAGVYSLGLGLPFIGVALGLRRVLGTAAFARRHAQTITHVGGALLVLTGILLVTGLWNALMIEIQVWISGVTLPI